MGNVGPYTIQRECTITGSKISPELCGDRQQCGSIACASCKYGERKKEKTMGNKKARCSVSGCDKQAWKDGMCYRHFNQQQRALVVAETEQEAPLPPEDRTPVRMSLVNRIPLVATPLSKPGFFLDFTGREDLLNAFENLSTNLNSDTLCLIELSIAGVLRRVL